MRLLFALLMIFLMIPRSGHATQVGSAAPQFVLNDTAGNRVSSPDYQGKVLLISFWAPWCIPCREELPAFEGLYDKFRKEGLAVLAISVEPSKEPVERFLRKKHVTYPVLLDEKKGVSDAYQCTHLPTTVFVGRDGTVKKIVKGYGRDSLSGYEQTVIELLKQQ